jgi:hypothetical protein
MHLYSIISQNVRETYHASESCEVVILTGLCAKSWLHERPLERELGIWNIFKLSVLNCTARYATGENDVKWRDRPTKKQNSPTFDPNATDTLERLTHNQPEYNAKRSNISSRGIQTSEQQGIVFWHTKKHSTLHGTGKFVPWSPEPASEPRLQTHESSKHVALCVEDIFYLTLRSHYVQVSDVVVSPLLSFLHY